MLVTETKILGFKLDFFFVCLCFNSHIFLDVPQLVVGNIQYFPLEYLEPMQGISSLL